jgi:cell division protein FtsI (penicillin-binding protein 3)
MKSRLRCSDGSQTGHVKAISNLGRAQDGSYYETTNYAVAESHEPGFYFKLVDLMAILEDKVADTSTVYDTHGERSTVLWKSC